MSKEFRNVAVLGRPEDPRVAEPMRVLLAHLTKAGCTVLVEADLDTDLPVRRLAGDELGAAADLIVSIGGDGAMLSAGKLAARHGVPLLGINRGRLGFLADVSPEEMLDSLDHVLAGDYGSDSRLLLTARLVSPDGSVRTAVAFNDVVLQRRESGRMVDVVASVAGKYVNTHSGDGLIVATPTGSTAYALSCGGPIIEPHLDAVVIVPICPHTLTDRPVVIAAGQTIEIRVLERKDTKAEVTVDGTTVDEIRPEDRLIVDAADTRIRLVHPPGHDFFGILRNKLFWGRDSRIRDITGE
ncbi:MAG: NAD(+) kinase [Woeseiaceae bacterium]|nr:NAD(+) kinase [Woeseiaceae bacterium]